MGYDRDADGDPSRRDSVPAMRVSTGATVRGSFFPVVGAISSAIGSLAALEAIKILSGTGRPLLGKMLTYDGHQGRVTTLSLTRRDDCPCCAEI